jgi:pyridoxal 5'-phosphate synthase pdxS subunit
MLAEVSRNLGEPMVGINVSAMAESERMAKRGW